MNLYLVAISLLLTSITATALQSSNMEIEAERLKTFIKKERPAFDEREVQKTDLLEELDKLNSDQNKVRGHVEIIYSNQQEMTMALENLSLEFEKQKAIERAEKQRVQMLFKLVYRVKRDGLLKFLVYEHNLGHLASKLRVLYRTLKSHSQATEQLKLRALRLSESEGKLKAAQTNNQKLLQELHEQEDLLRDLLDRRHAILKKINKRQSSYQLALKEYKRISRELTVLFNNFEDQRSTQSEKFKPLLGSLPSPVDSGRIFGTFGKSVNPKFGTVTYEKGIEIEAKHNSPVHAVLGGTIEYDGWVRGLGNVVIIHHGGGFYSLSARLFKVAKNRGTKVEQGDTIGYVGDTGGSVDQSSLYFELRENSRAVNPMLFFSNQAIAQLREIS